MLEMSHDDLCFELNRLRQRNEIIERENFILKQEYDLKKNPWDNTETFSVLESELGMRTAWLHKYRESSTLLGQKYQVIRRHLALEKISIQAIKEELKQGYTSIISDTERQFRLILKSMEINRLRKETEHALLISSMQEQASKELTELKSSLEQSFITINKLESIISTLETVNNREEKNLQDEIISLKSQIETLERKYYNEIQSLNDERKNLTTMNIDIQNAKLQLENILQQEKSKYKTLKDETETMKLSYEAKIKISKDIELSMTTTVEDLKTQIELQSKRSESFRIEYQNKNDTLTAQITQLQKKLDLLEQENKALKGREEKYRNDVSKSGLDSDDMKRRLASIQEKLRQIDSDHLEELNRLKAIQNELERRNWDIIQEKDKCINQNCLLESKIRELTNENTNNNNQINALKQEISLKEVELASLRQSNSQYTNELELKTKQIHETTHSLNQLREDRDEYEAMIQGYQQKINTHEQSIHQLTNELKESHIKLSILESKITSSESRSTSSMTTSDLQEALSAKTMEVEILKDVVRRECEERTELMIELANWKDVPANKRPSHQSSIHLSYDSTSGYDQQRQQGRVEVRGVSPREQGGKGVLPLTGTAKVVPMNEEIDDVTGYVGANNGRKSQNQTAEDVAWMRQASQRGAAGRGGGRGRRTSKF